MKCLSLWQPWATLVVSGAKRFETRSWHTPYSGPLLIHAAKRQDRASLDLCKTEPFRSALVAAGFEFIGDLQFGALVGSCQLVQCVRTIIAVHDFRLSSAELAFGDYSPGRFAWQLNKPLAFAQPIPYVGRQGLFNVPDSLVEVLR